MTTTEKVNELFDLYEKYGAKEYHGEPVTQLEHMYQSAVLAIENKYDDEVILAAFFHDIGYLIKDTSHAQMNNFGHAEHEKIGAAYLRKMGFPEKICILVEEHVNAKRYLCYKYPEYYEGLSDASKATLVFQGGKMLKEEADFYEQDSLFDSIIQMRKWDEAAKENEVPISISTLEHLKTLAFTILSKQKEKL